MVIGMAIGFGVGFALTSAIAYYIFFSDEGGVKLPW